MASAIVGEKNDTSMRQFLSSRLIVASPMRAGLETFALLGVLSLGVLVIYGIFDSDLYVLSFVCAINPLCALYYSLRRRLVKGRRWQVVSGEVSGLLLVVTLINAVPVLGLYYLESTVDGAAISLPVTLLVVGLVYFPYFFFRAALRALRWWSRIRETRLIWSLVHTHLIAAMIFQILLAIPCGLLFLSSATVTIDNPVYQPSNLISSVVYHMTILLPFIGLLMLSTIGVLLLLLPVSVSVSYFFARLLRRRLDALLRGAERAREGDYTTRVPISGKDEIAQLQTNFNLMVASLETTVQTLRTEQNTVQGLLDSRREMIVSVSHELRTPIATIRAYLDSLHRQAEHHVMENTPEIAGETNDWVILYREMDRLQHLIDDLFAFSRAEVDQLTLRITAVDAVSVIQRVVETVAPLAWRIHRVELINKTSPDLPSLMADATRLEQALLNLIHNGLRYTSPGGLIILNACVTGERVAITVRDTGQGITAQDLPHIWERYYRDRQNDGSGLGLALVKAFIEEMGGSVAVESALGSGTLFTLRLPMSSPPIHN